MRRFNTSNPEDAALEMARYRVRKIRRFFTHLFIFAIAVLIYVAKTYFGAPFNFWPIRHLNTFVMMVWAFIIAIQGVKLFFREIVFGNHWEQRKLNEFMQRDQQAKWE